jgi:hypothetical protein
MVIREIEGRFFMSNFSQFATRAASAFGAALITVTLLASSFATPQALTFTGTLV